MIVILKDCLVYMIEPPYGEAQIHEAMTRAIADYPEALNRKAFAVVPSDPPFTGGIGMKEESMEPMKLYYARVFERWDDVDIVLPDGQTTKILNALGIGFMVLFETEEEAQTTYPNRKIRTVLVTTETGEVAK